MLVVLHLLTLLLLVALGFYVFVADPRSRAHQTFATFIAFLAVWTTKDLVFWNFFTLDQAVGYWAAASFVTALLMQFSLVVFAWVFPENQRTPRKKAAVLFAPGIVLIPAALLGFLWNSTAFNNGLLKLEFTPLAFAFVVYVYFVFAYGAFILFRKYAKHRGTQAGQQIGAIIWGLMITGVLKTLANIALPTFDRYELLPYSSILVVPGVLIFAYAILNFKLFSLGSALNQFRLFPVGYKVAISIAMVAVGSFLLFQIPIVWWSFHNGMDAEGWRRYLVFSIVSALLPNLLLVLLILRTISRPLRRLTVAAVSVADGAYGTEVDMRKTNDEIGLLANSFNEMSRKMADDIAELKRLNDQLVRTEKLAAIGTLSAGVAHEVNNPLASISSMIQLMQRNGDNSPETTERLNLIAEQIERIKRVTGEMTNLARQRPSVRTNVDANEVIKRALRLVKFDSSFLDIEVREIINIKPIIIAADEDQLHQVFLNLLLNAKDAMPDGGTLTLLTETVDNEAYVEIRDTGVGISETQRKQVFDPFYTTKPAGKGTGLGLAVCDSIITAHGGTITILNNEPKGTIVRLRMPLTQQNSDD
ncbi:MAG TPA: ATP-binding protein [Pyrinomonadaceae bacterium]|nr:ATP-binding protein [Pyrinomonadaceae bacterium]